MLCVRRAERGRRCWAGGISVRVKVGHETGCTCIVKSVWLKLAEQTRSNAQACKHGAREQHALGKANASLVLILN